VSESDRVRLYLDGAERWRWRWTRGGNVVAESVQGYIAKRDCINALTDVTRTTYELTYESRRNPVRRAYQQGRLRSPGKPIIFVEVTPWGLDQNQ
jgi:uncharacterized protein YegP (UPF0339 family)